MADVSINWTEDDSAVYQQLAMVAVPDREEQIATIVALLPFDADARFTVVEPGSGEGYLSETILECFPAARVIALDGSAEMLAIASERLERFGERFTVRPFDIEDLSWVETIAGANAVVSSLCVHHLTGDGKQKMFEGLSQAIAPGGALIISDLVSGRHPVHHHLLGTAWDHETRKRSMDRTGGSSGWEAFQEEHWNIYWWPDEMDRPSGLFEQLRWMAEAGFDPVDCFWLKGAHAIYGGYLPGGPAPERHVGFEAALAVSRRVLGLDS